MRSISSRPRSVCSVPHGRARSPWRGAALVLGLVAGLGGCSGPGEDAPPQDIEQTSQSLVFNVGNPLGWKLNTAGFARTARAVGRIDTTNPFFQSLGTNGRSCNTCHQVGEGWSITPAGVRLRFWQTDGTDPLFQAFDMANAPSADVSTREARLAAYSLLLERAVVRVGLPVKPDSEFELAAVDDPYGHASAAQLSLFRRPLATTNLRLLGTLNWDGRTVLPADPTNLRQSLKNQANGATMNHAKPAAPIADDVREAIVEFETSITTTQQYGFRAGYLEASGGLAGPELILGAPLVGTGPDGTAVTGPAGFTLFAAWGETFGGSTAAKAEVAEGERLFNERPLGPSGVTCASCHNATNVGGSTGFRLFDVGVSAASRRAPNVPLYTFRNKATGETLETTDPGRALISGKWSDMNKFKVPGLRSLAARPPYFHDGSAPTLAAVMDHYDTYFSPGFTADEKRKLVRFLEAL